MPEDIRARALHLELASLAKQAHRIRVYANTGAPVAAGPNEQRRTLAPHVTRRRSAGAAAACRALSGSG